MNYLFYLCPPFQDVVANVRGILTQAFFFDISKKTQGGSQKNSSNFPPKTQASLLKTK